MVQNIFAAHTPQTFALFFIKGKPQHRDKGKRPFAFKKTHVGHSSDNVIFRHMSVKYEQ